MKVLEEALTVLSVKQGNPCHNSITQFYNTTINTSDFVHQGHSFVCIGRTEKYVVRCFIIITAEPKRIETVLKAMLKFVFKNAKVTQAYPNIVNSVIPLEL